MSSINPVFLLPGALAARAESIANAFVDSLALGAGQFCTNPGLLVGIQDPALESFVMQACQAVSGRTASTMLTPGIHDAYEKGVSRLEQNPAAQMMARGHVPTGPFEAQVTLFKIDATAFLADAHLAEENFGPSAVLVVCKDVTQLQNVIGRLEGQLTATVQIDAADHPLMKQLLPALERKAGRILVNDFPTGVEVCNAMVHGGPFPSTSDSRTTSVGASAIERFLRPVCYQNVPEALLPAALQDDNPLAIWRLFDGELSRG